MGWFQKCYETYDNNLHMAGRIVDGMKPLCPNYHITQKVQIEITVNEDGSFSGASEVAKGNYDKIIPVTKSSGSRSSGIAAHMLSDSLEYLAMGNEKYPDNAQYKKKYENFMDNISAWHDFDPDNVKLSAIYKYCQGGEMVSDLAAAGVIKVDEDGRLAEGKIDGNIYAKCTVCWRVNSLSEDVSAAYEDTKLFESYRRFVDSKDSASDSICYVLGKELPTVDNHPKGIVRSNYNAKLICANGDVYKGRFHSADEAVTISSEATEKAHSALRWIAANQGSMFGGRTYVAWNPKGKKVPNINRSFGNSSSDEDNSADDFPNTMPEYKRKIDFALNGYRQNFDKSDDVVIMAMDAATAGRLSITYYNELKASDFLDRIEKWNESCCWFFKRFNAEKKPCLTIYTPSTMSIVNYAFGFEQGNIIKADEKIVRDQYQCVFRCIADCQPVPANIVHAITGRASNLLVYSSNTNRENVLSTACALIRKYRNEKNESEDWQMSLDLTNTNRSYLFGRLLAVAEKVERSTYMSQDEGRETNAIRLQSAFAQHPMHTWRLIDEQLRKAYYPKLPDRLREYYLNIAGSIVDILLLKDYASLNAGLEDIYLLGYYLQRKELNTKKEDKSTKENTNTEEEQ